MQKEMDILEELLSMQDGAQKRIKEAENALSYLSQVLARATDEIEKLREERDRAKDKEDPFSRIYKLFYFNFYGIGGNIAFYYSKDGKHYRRSFLLDFFAATKITKKDVKRLIDCLNCEVGDWNDKEISIITKRLNRYKAKYGQEKYL